MYDYTVHKTYEKITHRIRSSSLSGITSLSIVFSLSSEVRCFDEMLASLNSFAPCFVGELSRTDDTL